PIIINNRCRVAYTPRNQAPYPLLFFFQGEDGIRAPLVTGVQTCALPIYRERDRTDRGDRGRPGRQRGALVGAGLLGWERRGAERQRQDGEARELHCKRSRMWSPTRSALAMMVRAGFTAPLEGKKLPSTTYRLSS